MLNSKTKLLSSVLLVCILVLLFASCGASMKASDTKGGGFEVYSYDGAPMEMEAISASDAEYSMNYSKDEMAEVQYEKPTAEIAEKNPLEGRKIIKTVNITAETKEFDTAVAAIEQKINALGGYVQNSNATGTSLDSGRIYNRNASYTIRIPAEKLGDFLSCIGELVNISSNKSNIDDVTETYVDIEARLKTLRTEETRLLELLEKAAGLSDIITLENRLSEVTYQIESYTARLRSYDTLIAFSTVYLNLNEVVDYTKPEVQNPTFGERVSKAFKESREEFADGWRDFAVDFVYALPTLIIFAIVIAAIVIIIRVCVKRSKKRSKAKQPAPENKPQA